MKKCIFVLAVAFLVFTCADLEINPFIGTWENEDCYRTIFTETVVSVYYPSGNLYWTGTYTYNDTHLIINLDQTISDSEMVESWGDTQLVPYRFEDEIMFFNYVRLTKIKD